MIADDSEVPRKRLKFRSYKPHDDSLQGKKLDQATASSIDDTVSTLMESAKNTSTEIDLNTLAPRKANWDLKRDVEKKLSKLERRTKRAMAELIREKLKSEKEISAPMDDQGGSDSH